MNLLKSYVYLISNVQKWHGDNAEDAKWHDMGIVKEGRIKGTICSWVEWRITFIYNILYITIKNK